MERTVTEMLLVTKKNKEYKLLVIIKETFPGSTTWKLYSSFHSFTLLLQPM